MAYTPIANATLHEVERSGIVKHRHSAFERASHVAQAYLSRSTATHAANSRKVARPNPITVDRHRTAHRQRQPCHRDEHGHVQRRSAIAGDTSRAAERDSDRIRYLASNLRADAGPAMITRSRSGVSVGNPLPGRTRTLRANATSGTYSGGEPTSILTWWEAEASLEMTMQVALVGEPGSGGDVGNRVAAFEQPSGLTDAVSDLQCVGR